MFSVSIASLRRSRFRRSRRVLVAALAAVAFAACEDPTGDDSAAGTFYAPAVSVGNGTARTYVTRDASGVATSLGVEMTEAALEGLPASPVMLNLPLPSEAGATQYTFVMLDWNPQGHEPDHVYTVPHFDFHFYMAPQAEVAAIAGGPDPVLPESRFVPAGYVSPGNMAVPSMGVHWIDSAAGELHGRPFDQTLLFGFTGGKMIFVEPMITRAFLQGRPSFSAPVKLPQAFQRGGRYPHRYGIRYDAADRVFRISMDELTAH